MLVLLLFGCGAGPEVSFNAEIKPLINKKCISCHGGVKRNSGFSLLFRQDALDTTESGKPAILPGDAAHSEVMRRITAHDPEDRMPYKEEPLSKEEIELIRRWIDQGAQWETHWAYLPPKVTAPVTSAGFFSPNEFVKGPIDAYVLDGMRTQGLEPAEEADRRTLIRRVSLDLTGVPPAPSEVERFVKDDRSNAYEVLVDTLLGRSQFGERWASWWLDMARYSDTRGYEKDGSRTIWRYRDWVIRAFNSDMPFDRFTVEQLAGDLLPDPTDDQYIATAFHRNTMNNDEGGTDDEEFRVASVIDRVNTTFQVWQSTTFGCVQCHSHPYDPFRHEEYYKVMAFFNNTRDEDTEGEFPRLREYGPEERKEMEAIIDWCRRKDHRSEDRVRLFLRTMEPISHPHRCDDFVNGSLMDNKWIGIRHGGRCRIPGVDLHGKEFLMFNYWTGSGGGRFEITVDRPDGPVLVSGSLPKTDGSHALHFPLRRSVLGKGGEIRNLFWKFFNNTIPADRSVCGVEWFVFQEALPLGEPVVSDRFMKLVNASPLTTPVMVENNSEYFRKTHVFERGNREVKGKVVVPAVPASLNPLPEGAKADRLGFAQWLVDPANPLTGRTIANRLWEQLFGQGIVSSIEDFGTQGERPSHPELLDYLSVQFTSAHHWSMKKLLKEIVMSGTYRQDSRITNDKDPSNRWLSRGPRIRLNAEQVRDQALSVSGLLSGKMYGKGVMPYQPDRVWQSVYSGETWEQSQGEDQYRRAVYTFQKRTSPYPSMMMFDGSSREVCVVQRVRTNTPLQALVTLNDPVFVEAASRLADQSPHEKKTLDRIAWMYERAMFRPAPVEKLEPLVDLYTRSLTAYRSDPLAAEKVMACRSAEPSDAALRLVALAILNLDEFLTKE